MAWQPLIFALCLFAFIVSMMGTLGCFFGRRWKWFILLLFCVVISSACTGVELYLIFGPSPEHELPVVIRNPLVPL